MRIAIGAMVAAVSVTALAQAPPAGGARAEFEVASVKPTASDRGPRGISFSPSGRFAWNSMTLAQLMQSAYGELQTRQIVGGPAWIDSARFDIAATSPEALLDLGPGGEPRGLFARLRTLLEDRFALKTHVENRELSVYALEPAAVPLTIGRNLRRVDVDCETVVRDMAAGRAVATAGGQAPPCSNRSSLGQISGRAIPMSRLAEILSGPAGRPVIDRTGLTGNFDVEMKWAPELPPGTINGAPAPPSDGPSIFTAVREQLGLRLQATRAPVPVLVVDSAERPTPD